MSSSGINFSGLSSGIDTETMISQLMKLQQRPITALQKQGAQIQQQQVALGQFTALVSGLQAAAATISSANGFSLVKASSADSTIATITAQSGAQAGSHTLKINQLAQAQRIGSKTMTDVTTPLGVSGQIVVNGKAITVAATDTLQSLAANINGAQVGVNASIVTTGTNASTLVLASAKPGASNDISISDTAGGTILRNTLGLLGNGATVANAVTNGAASGLFDDSATSLGTLLGLTSPAAGDIQIDGTAVHLDLATDSLAGVAGKINTAGIAGVTATVTSVADPTSGTTRQQLTITGASTPTFTDSNNILANLGILQNAPSHQLAAARDASFELDGLTMTRSSNTVSDALSGVTLNLLKDTDTPTTALTIDADTDTIKSNIKSFVSQYNQIVDLVKDQGSFDTSTLVAGPLFGDSTVAETLDSITQIVTGAVSGITGTYASMGEIGISLDNTGHLTADDSKLSDALNGHLADVRRLFASLGVTSDSSISFLSSGSKTVASGTSGYAVDITQLATQASLTAGTQHTANDNPNTEALTFSGDVFGGGGHTVFLSANSSLDQMVSQINADKTVAAYVTAANMNGKLTLTAKQYGSAYSFSVLSSQAAAANNSGIGNGSGASGSADAPAQATGLDVAGTINGEAATGKGQILTGNTGNANTEGLALRVTSTLIGSHGTVSVTRGIADQLNAFAQGATDYVNGTLTLYSHSFDDEITELNTRITDLTDASKREEDRLRTQFAAMESAISKIKAASAGLSSLTTTTTSS